MNRYLRKFKRLTACFLAAIVLAAACACPASAEGFAFNWDSDNNSAPHCKSLLLLNLDTDTVVYTLNADEPLPMASLTKIMTYIVAYETIPNMETATITVPQSVADELANTGSSLADIAVGEQFTGLQLLYLMMVPSGNDAALTFAKHVDSLFENGTLTLEPETDETTSEVSEDGDSSTVSEVQKPVWEPTIMPNAIQDPTDYTNTSYFVYLMNRKARELGCTNTRFTNPHGLHNDNHYASARDMAIITKYAMTLPNFTEITGTTAYVQAPTNLRSNERTVYTTNKMLTNYADDSGLSYYYQSATGIKTGSHDQAGYCITASATAFGYTYIVVALGCDMYDDYGNRTGIHGEMLDARSLFRWAFSSLEKKSIAVEGDILSSVKLEYAFQKDELLLAASENVSVMLPSSVDISSIVVTATKPDSVQAPIQKGEQIGVANLSYADEIIATVPLVAAESVSRSELIAGWEQGKSLLTQPWFMVILAAIAALVIVYVILVFAYRRKQRKLRRVRKFRDM